MHTFDNLISCTTRLIGIKGGQEISYGTGFFFVPAIMSTKSGEQATKLSIITNKHVIANADEIGFVISTSNLDGSDVEHEYRVINSAHAITHPNPNIDLCAFDITNVQVDIANRQRRAMQIAVSFDDIAADDDYFKNLLPLEQVLMVGYPTGLWDEVNNGALARSGVLASNPAHDFKGKPDIVVDLACFPGSSGSPVFLFNPVGYQTRAANIMGSRVKLIGVLYAGPTADARGIVTSQPAPVSIGQEVSVRTMMNLGYAVKTTQLQPIIEIFRRNLADLIAQHEK